MPLADDTSGVIFENVYSIPGNPAIGDAPDPNAPLGVRVIDLSDLSDDMGEHVGHVDTPYGTVSGATIDAGAWFVDRFWIIPNPVDFGNILSDKPLTVTILNAFRSQDHELTDIDEATLATLGVTITAGPDRPARLRVSEQISYTFTATLDGIPTFDTPIDFTFDPLP